MQSGLQKMTAQHLNFICTNVFPNYTLCAQLNVSISPALKVGSQAPAKSALLCDHAMSEQHKFTVDYCRRLATHINIRAYNC